MNKKTKRSIIFIIVSIVIILFVFLLFGNFKKGKYIEITIEDKLYGTYSLNKEQTIKLDNNIIEIKDGYAYMFEANCPDHTCISMGKIANNNQMIVCLPNKVIVKVIDTNTDLDLNS